MLFGAVDRRQASLMYDEMAAIIEAVPEFAARTKIRTGGQRRCIEVVERSRARVRSTRRCRPMRGAAMAWRRRGGPMTRWRRPGTGDCSMRCAPRWASASAASASSCRPRPRTTSIRCRN